EQQSETIYVNIEIHTYSRHELHCFMYHQSVHHPGDQSKQIDANQESDRQDEPARVYTSVIPVERACENDGNDRKQNRQMYKRNCVISFVVVQIFVHYIVNYT